jgi:hypothetical protein
MRNPMANPGHVWDVIASLKDLAIDDGEPVDVAELRRGIGREVRVLERFVQAWEGSAKKPTRKAVRHA